jgi:hypothetical protein
MFSVTGLVFYHPPRREQNPVRVLVAVEDMDALVKSGLSEPVELRLYPGRRWLLWESPDFQYSLMGPRSQATESDLRREVRAWLNHAKPGEESQLRRCAAQVYCAIVGAYEILS